MFIILNKIPQNSHKNRLWIQLPSHFVATLYESEERPSSHYTKDPKDPSFQFVCRIFTIVLWPFFYFRLYLDVFAWHSSF